MASLYFMLIFYLKVKVSASTYPHCSFWDKVSIQPTSNFPTFCLSILQLQAWGYIHFLGKGISYKKSNWRSNKQVQKFFLRGERLKQNLAKQPRMASNLQFSYLSHSNTYVSHWIWLIRNVCHNESLLQKRRHSQAGGSHL